MKIALLTGLAALCVTHPAAAATVADAVTEIKGISAMDSDPSKNLTFNVLRYMAANIRSLDQVGQPAPRDPHEWTGERVLAEGNFNGCVEAAKAFKALYDASDPPWRSVYVLGTMRGRDGGHAVIQITAADDVPFLVDTVMFQRVTPTVTEAEVARTEGKTFQTRKEDIHIDKRNGHYIISRWQYRYLFHEDRRLGLDLEFKDLREVNEWLAKNAATLHDFADIEKAGLIKHENNGTFIGPQDELEHIFLKTEEEPFSGTDQERIKSGQRALEDEVKNAR